MRDPAFRIGHLPALVLVRRTFENLREIFDHLLPLHRIAFLKGHALAESAIGQDDRILPVLDRTVDVGTKYIAVLHRNRLVPGDPHAVADFRPLIGVGRIGRPVRLGIV